MVAPGLAADRVGVPSLSGGPWAAARATAAELEAALRLARRCGGLENNPGDTITLSLASQHAPLSRPDPSCEIC